jgi:hypothetical protein
MEAVTMMNYRSQLFWVWGGVLAMVAFTIGWVGLEQFLPLPHPNDSPAQIAHLFSSHKTGIRFGAIFMIMGTMLWVPWAAVVAAQTAKTEGDHPVNAWTQVGSAVVATALVIMGEMIWVVAAFRPERNPDITQALSDIGFISQIMPFMVFVIWNLSLGWSILCDDRPEPAFPRWAAYFCAWTALLYVPGGALAFFHDGPFAWNGALAFYLPAAAFFLWIVVITYLTYLSIRRNRPVTTTSVPQPSAAAPVSEPV